MKKLLIHMFCIYFYKTKKKLNNNLINIIVNETTDSRTGEDPRGVKIF
jgi:hypothetical protein